MTEPHPEYLSRFRAEGPSQLLECQEPAVKIVLRRIIEIARIADELGKGAADSNLGRPHQVFTVDGARGAGKTYVLHTLASAIQRISSRWNCDRTDNWLRWCLSQEEAAALVAPVHFSYLAHVIQIIFPSDMEQEESIMERIFAHIKEELDKGLSGDERLLRKMLLRDVLPGWHFSKADGREVLIREADSYDDFADTYEAEAQKAALRVENWRRFLDAYLDHSRIALLVVFLDDTDVHPDVTDDILRTIRIFLNHPRVVTILAGNIRSIRSLLLHKGMRLLSESMGVLGERTSPTANDWRRLERRRVEDFLEKVLPHSHRIFIQQPAIKDGSWGAAAVSAERPNVDDFGKIAGITLGSLCSDILRKSRKSFLDTKFVLVTNRAVLGGDRPSPIERRKLDDFISWWVFAVQYQDALAPRSARQIATLRDYYVHRENGKAVGEPLGRRLIMALFENPANFSIIQQFGDNDVNVTTWLQDQVLDSEWVGPRRFHVNGRLLDRGQFGYDYLRFRLDVGLAMPVRQNAEEAIPTNLLPIPHGRTHLRRFFQPQRMARRHRRLGINQWIDHAAIPGNCLYFHDLDALPDRSLLHGTVSNLRKARSEKALDDSAGTGNQGLGQGYWERWLANNWIDQIDDLQDEFTYRYFADIACASQAQLHTVPTANMLRLLDPPSLIDEREEGLYEVFWREEFGRFAYSTSHDIAEINEESLFALRSLRSIINGSARRRSDVLARIRFLFGAVDDEDRAETIRASDLFSAADLTTGQFRNQLSDLAKRLSPTVGEPFTRYERIRIRSLALYATLINDIRRAWHATRIYDLSMGALGRVGKLSAATEGRGDERMSFTVLAAQDRLTLYTADSIRRHFEGSRWAKELLAAFNTTSVICSVNTVLDWCWNQHSAVPSTESDGPSQMELADLIRHQNRLHAAYAEVHVKPGASSGQRDVVSTLRALTELGSAIDKESYIDDEKADYDRWIRTLRAVGRALVQLWPDFGDHTTQVGEAEDGWSFVSEAIIGRLHSLEEALLGVGEDTPRLTVLRPAGIELISEDTENIQDKSRSARNFILLLYGLAPSLAAVAHCHLMGIMRDAEMNYQALKHADQSDADRARDTMTRCAEVAIQLDKWVDLICSLAITLRYVRVKYLLLHMGLWLETGSNDVNADNNPISEVGGAGTSQVDRMVLSMFNDLDLPRVDNPSVAKGVANEISDRLIALFKPSGMVAATELAIMPDVASSTMFGDRWLADTVVSLAKSGEFDCCGLAQLSSKASELDGARAHTRSGPLAADGICQETEQWLWAAMRCVKKFHRESRPVIDSRSRDLLKRYPELEGDQRRVAASTGLRHS